MLEDVLMYSMHSRTPINPTSSCSQWLWACCVNIVVVGGAVPPILAVVIPIVPSWYCCWPLPLPSLLVIVLPWPHQPSLLLAPVIHPKSRGSQGWGGCSLIPFFPHLPPIVVVPPCSLFLSQLYPVLLHEQSQQFRVQWCGCCQLGVNSPQPCCNNQRKHQLLNRRKYLVLHK